MDKKLEALLDAARTATPGPWFYQEKSDAYTHIIRPSANHGRIVVSFSQHSNGTSEKDARDVALANPATIQALVERVAAMEGALTSISADWSDETARELVRALTPPTGADHD